MTRLLFKALLLSFAIFAYAASPFVTAWSIREAARNGDSAYLERAIDWPSVRETLKPALSSLVFDMPDPATQPDAKPTMWQRFKAYWGQGAMNRAIDGYLTPEGLPKLFALRNTYRSYTGAVDEDKSRPVLERMQRFWSRVKRAEFTSLTSFEVDMIDKHDQNRMFLGKLELTGTGWILRELRIKFLKPGTTAPGVATPSPLPGPSAPSETAPMNAPVNQIDARSDAPAARAPGWRVPAAGPVQQFVESNDNAPAHAVRRTGWLSSFVTPAEAAPAQPSGFIARAKAAARGTLRGDR